MQHIIKTIENIHSNIRNKIDIQMDSMMVRKRKSGKCILSRFGFIGFPSEAAEHTGLWSTIL